MSFDEMLKKYKAKTCILSIEKIDETNYGNIRVVAGNQAHCEDILHITGHPFVPGCPYEMCFPKNMNFEDFCYRAAIGGEPMHTYVNLYQMGLWLNMFMIPLESEEENKGYCIYTYDVTPQANTEHMSDLSVEASSKVLQTCIKLRGSTDFEKTMDEIIGDIRDICGADKCCVLIIDYDNKKCHVGAESSRSEEFIPLASRLDESFYEMALTNHSMKWPCNGNTLCKAVPASSSKMKKTCRQSVRSIPYGANRLRLQTFRVSSLCR